MSHLILAWTESAFLRGPHVVQVLKNAWEGDKRQTNDNTRMDIATTRPNRPSGLIW